MSEEVEVTERPVGSPDGSATAVAPPAGWSLGEPQWIDAVEHLGPEIVFELTVLVGYYSTLALQLRVLGDEHLEGPT
jgi:hypothetical protein